jgi:hypothetical protein
MPPTQKPWRQSQVETGDTIEEIIASLAGKSGILASLLMRLERIDARLQAMEQQLPKVEQLLELRPDAKYVIRIGPKPTSMEIETLTNEFATRGLDVIIIESESLEVGQRSTVG